MNTSKTDDIQNNSSLSFISPARFPLIHLKFLYILHETTVFYYICIAVTSVFTDKF